LPAAGDLAQSLAIQHCTTQDIVAIDDQFHAVCGVQTGRASESAAVRDAAAGIGVRHRTLVGWHGDSSGAWQIRHFAVSGTIGKYRGTRQWAILPGASQTDDVSGGVCFHRTASDRHGIRLIVDRGIVTLSIVRETSQRQGASRRYYRLSGHLGTGE
jgi:hypothetical protein